MTNDVLELGPIFSEFLHRGYKLFNAARIAPTEKEHARAYYEFMAPQSNSFIVDMGAGTGECGVLLQELDPSLEILNVVNDPALIKLMQNLQLDCLYASFEDTSIPAQTADVVMFNESIGHGDLDKALAEEYYGPLESFLFKTLLLLTLVKKLVHLTLGGTKYIDKTCLLMLLTKMGLI